MSEPGPKALRAHWLNAERVMLGALPLLAVMASLAWLWLQPAEHGLRGTAPLVADFITYWSASSLTLSGHPEAAYDLQQITAVAQAAVPGFPRAVSWHYPPTFLLVVWPLALLSLSAAWFVFLGGSFALYALVLHGSLRPLLRAANFSALRGWLQILLPMAAFPGIAINLLYGQNAFLTAALMGAGMLLLRSRPLWAGVCFGLLAIKPHLALLVPLALLCARQWRAVLGAALSACGSLALSLALFGMASLQGFFVGMTRARHWLEAAGSYQRQPVRPEQIDAQWVEHARLARNAIPSLFSFLRELNFSLTLAYGMHALLVLAVVVIVLRAWRGTVSWSLRFALLSLGSLLVTPYLFDYELSWLLLPLVWCVVNGVENGWWRGERELLLLIALLPLPLFLISRLWPQPYAVFLLLGFFAYVALRSEVALQGAKTLADRRASGPDEGYSK